jgi:glycyl-tRNA synthetase beta chain
MTDFLLELRSEEIPARMQARARNDLARLFAEAMAEAGLPTGAIDTHSTPRRLVLIARDVAQATDAVREEEKGPPQSAADSAIDGFCNKHGISRAQLEIRDVKGRPTYFAVIDKPGRSAVDVLQARIPSIIFNFPWPKSMRWGEGDLRWVRPLHNVLAILGDQPVVIDMSKWASVYVHRDDPTVSNVVAQFSGVTSLPQTLGHRFHHPGPITIGGAGDYIEKLRACHVIVDQDERERLIREGAEKAAAEAGLTLLADEGLVVENAGLAEWPVLLVGRFDPDFLDVPREVIVLTMRTNQKYFACADDSGALAPAFVCVANIDAKDGGEAIVEGNRRVLAARLADARFFWEQDLKVPLEEQAAKLAGIVFHDKLGTVADKVERVAKLARWLVEEKIVKGAKPDQVERAARLAKADLVTGMVGEFPELQGVIGGYLAEAQGEPKAVADAIRDHYKPVGQGDDVPTAPVTVAVALADKMDTIVAFYGVGEFPTGSKDPFGLRRAALGIISLVEQNGLRFNVRSLVSQQAEEVLRIAAAREFTAKNVGALNLTSFQGQVPDDHFEYQISELLRARIEGLFVDRLKVQQREAGVRHDLIDAVFALGGEDDLMRLLARVNALQDFVGTEDGTNLLTAYKRAANILKREKWEGEGRQAPDQVRGDGLEAQEAALIAALDKAEPKAAKAIEKEDFTGAMAALATLRGPIDQFFDHVTVNDPDKAKRARRLNLLMRFRDAVNRVADFSKIEG